MKTSAQEIERIARTGELIPLLCAVAEMTGDSSLLAEEFRPKLDLEMISIPLSGGLDPDIAAAAFDRVAAALRRHVESSGSGPGAKVSSEEILDFLTDGDSAYADLVRHELGEPEDVAWTKEALAPDRPLTVAIVGAGQAGLAMARTLRSLGIDFMIFERSDKVGGTWRWNTYPGCRLDTSTLAYSYSFFQKQDWRHYFAPREALEEYFYSFAEQEELLDRVQFNSSVVKAAWGDEDRTWELTVRDEVSGDESVVTANALISAVGILNQPKIPPFNGLENFGGTSVHSADWDDSVQVAGKRVNVIGTGASAYQIAPAIVDEVASLKIFQRSAPWILPAPLYQAEVGDDRRWLIENVPSYHRWLRLWEFWHSTIGKYALTKADPTWTSSDSVSEPNRRFRDALVENIKGQYVGHEHLLEDVIPRYPVGVKRMLRDNGKWAKTLQSPVTTLVTQEIESFDADGVRTVDGEHHGADVTVFATGFHGTSYLATMDVRGREGRSLREVWGEEARAHKGAMVPGFPNLFCLAGPNTGLVAIGSQTFMTECGVRYIADCLRFLLSTGADAIEPTEHAYRDYISWIDEGNRGMAWAAAPERSWYRNANGTNTVVWPFPLLDYFELTRAVDEKDLEIHHSAHREVPA